MKATVQAELDFPILVKTYHSMIWRYLRLLGCESALAEDLTQEVFLFVLKKPFQQISESATSSYLRRVARNKFLDHMRRMNRHREFDVEQAEQVWLEQNRDDDGQFWIVSLRQCIEELEERPRHVLHLRYRDKVPIRKVAESVEMKESGIKTMLGRIKSRLRECVQRKVDNS